MNTILILICAGIVAVLTWLVKGRPVAFFMFPLLVLDWVFTSALDAFVSTAFSLLALAKALRTGYATVKSEYERNRSALVALAVAD